MSGPATFSWIGTTREDWSTPTSWADVTTGETPAIVVPGSLDIATVNNGTIAGTGDAAYLTFLGANTVLGDVNTGTLVTGGSASAPSTLNIDAGATVGAAVAIDPGTISVAGGAAALLVNGLLQIGTSSSAGELFATAGAMIQAGSVFLGSSSNNELTVDASSTIEIGNTGAPAAGALTIDADRYLSGSGFLIGNLVDNGVVRGYNITLGQPIVYAGGQGASTFEGSEFPSQLSGTGTLEAEADGTITLQEPVTTSGLTFWVDGAANLEIEASIAAGNTIDITGGLNTLTIDDQWYLVEHPAEQLGQSPVFTGRPPTVDATINGFGSSDALCFVDDPLLGTTITAASFAGGVLTLFNGNVEVSAFSLAGNYEGESFIVGPPNNSEQLITVACFESGTNILTAHGETPVENLREGDSVTVVRTSGYSEEKIRWIGHRRVDLTAHPQPQHAAPICIRRDAFGPSQPHRDLQVSPEHCIFFEGKLIPAYLLVNDMTILQRHSQANVHYFHIELDRHGILLAEGLPTESYLDTGNRSTFANAGISLLLHPEFRVNDSLRTWHEDACAPLTVDQATLKPIWQRLADRAKRLGFSPRRIITDSDPALRAIVAGRVINAVHRSTERFVCVLPSFTTRVTLSSRATRPSDIVPYQDRRLLGVAVSRVTLRSGREVRDFAVDALSVGSGWHEPERANGVLWRWTNGAGELLLDPLPVATLMEIRLVGSTQYLIEEVPASKSA